MSYTVKVEVRDTYEITVPEANDYETAITAVLRMHSDQIVDTGVLKAREVQEPYKLRYQLEMLERHGITPEVRSLAKSLIKELLVKEPKEVH
jgi:hypothetical protein